MSRLQPPIFSMIPNLFLFLKVFWRDVGRQLKTVGVQRDSDSHPSVEFGKRPLLNSTVIVQLAMLLLVSSVSLSNPTHDGRYELFSNNSTSALADYRPFLVILPAIISEMVIFRVLSLTALTSFSNLVDSI